ncbi:hypothetical protein SAMD00019534_045140 [Acytostelium subglobosum LB1]|uniref:hypothetical protein n=1 Tax=Acytostelium subglobosum LB1 TaxID=1410327 RepID=UPI0006450A03|nr:hypothetical protein SAMD00019534_045140 [Acytostelium subglobosum LB1]GAM21339.1 hypothetical protein SAMD00019534_045140 [Acytostelium subglobosum LB1]|eukprot:XP_012755458.1 hypothetical protein SAMD00019534_045140 [Acytostelium subglobosum LB1]
MDSNDQHLHFDSLATKRVEVKGPVNSLSTPIYTSSTFYLDNAQHGAALCLQDSVQDGQSPWLYSRWGNPTNDVAERLITKLEVGRSGLTTAATYVTSSGMSAISTALLALLHAGDHAVFPTNIYGGTHEVITDLLPKMGVSVTCVDPSDINNFVNAIKPNTKMLYGETPANPTMILTDLAALGNLGRTRNITTVVDATFGSVYNTRPLEHGIDVVVHSATKYYGGHSDLIAGTITSANAALHDRIGHYLRLLGGTASPHTTFLLQRGIKTLHLRMERHNQNALRLAQFLQSHAKVERVHYPGLESHPQHELAKKQMQPGFGGMIAFEVRGGADAGRRVIESVQLITLAVSLGGVESLIEQASTMTHTMVDRDTRERSGITDGLLRFSVGCENIDDLIADLTQALEKA